MSWAVKINEPVGGITDQTAHVNIGESGSSQSFDLQLGQRGTAEITFIIRAGDTYQPTVGSPIYIYQGSACRFAGTIDSVESNWLGNAGDFTSILTCVSLEGCFDNLLIPPRTYTEQTAGYIVADLLSSVCYGVPVTAGTIQAGPTIPIQFYAYDSVSSALDDLCTLAGFVWSVDPTTSELNFRVPSAIAAPFTVTGDNTIWESMDWLWSRQNYRNMQVAKLSFDAFPPSNDLLAPGATTYNLNWPVDNIKEAFVTAALRANVDWTMLTIPTAGDTVTVGDAVYTWVTTLDNTQEFEILIGATTGDCSFHLQHAICADPSTAGVEFSLPTWENGLFNGGTDPSSSSTTAWVKVPGAAGNSYGVASSNVDSLYWATPTATGGVDGTSTALNVGTGTSADSGSSDLIYTQGSNVITLAVAPTGYLSVVYWRIGGDCIAVRDDALIAARAAIEHGTGKYEMLTDDSSETNVQSGLTFARAALTTYDDLPITFYFYTNVDGLLPGQWLDLSYSGASPSLAALVTGNWLVQEVTATLIPGSEVWQYQVYVVNATVANYLNFWLNLLGGSGGGGSSGGSGSSGGGGGGTANITTQYVTVAGSSPAAITPASPAGDGALLVVIVLQDSTGYAISWSTEFSGVTATTVPTTPNTRSVLMFAGATATGTWYLLPSTLGRLI